MLDPAQTTPKPATTGSPKTTLLGLLAAVGLALLAGGDYFDVQALKAIGGTLAALGAVGTGIAAKDH